MKHDGEHIYAQLSELLKGGPEPAPSSGQEQGAAKRNEHINKGYAIWAGVDIHDPEALLCAVLGAPQYGWQLDFMSSGNRVRLAQLCKGLVPQDRPLSDEYLLMAANDLPELVPDLLRAGANPHAMTSDTEGRGVLDNMAYHAAYLTQTYGDEETWKIFEETMSQGVYPNPHMLGRDMPTLANLVFKMEQGAVIFKIIEKGLSLSNKEATAILMVSSITSDSTPELIRLAVKHGGDVFDAMPESGNWGEGERILDRARKSYRPEIVHCFNELAAEAEAQQLNETTHETPRNGTRRI